MNKTPHTQLNKFSREPNLAPIFAQRHKSGKNDPFSAESDYLGQNLRKSLTPTRGLMIRQGFWAIYKSFPHNLLSIITVTILTICCAQLSAKSENRFKI